MLIPSPVSALLYDDTSGGEGEVEINFIAGSFSPVLLPETSKDQEDSFSWI